MASNKNKPTPINADAVIEDPTDEQLDAFNAATDADTSEDEPVGAADQDGGSGATIADDAYNVAAVVKGIADQHRWKPELAFKIIELCTNYSLAKQNLLAQMNYAPPGVRGPQDATDEETPTDG